MQTYNIVQFKDNMRIKDNVSKILVVLSPILAIVIVALITGTNPFYMDAWNTTWNDEIGYYRAANCIKNYGLPLGWNGYNEVLTSYPTLGPYNYITYLPHVVILFFTSFFGNNMIVYANVLMLVIAYAFAVLLLKPSFEKCVWMIIFQFVNVICTRYGWSGMSEAASIAMVLITVACAIFLFEGDCNSKCINWMILFVQVILILLFGIIRPFLWTFILFPLFYVFKNIKESAKTKWIITGLILTGQVMVLLLYFWMNNNLCAPFFGATGLSDGILGLISRGEMKQTIEVMVNGNREALNLVMADIKVFGWRSVIIISLLVQMVMFCVAAIFKRKDIWNNIYLLGLLYVVIALTVYEANILLYTVNQLHRMLLAIMVGAVFLGIMSMNNISQVLYQVFFAIMIFGTIVNGREAFNLPQKNDLYDAEIVTNELSKVLPPDKECDPWEMTFASTPNHGSYYPLYAMPTYLGAQCCRSDWLKNQIMDGKLKSRYVLLCVDDDMETRVYCDENFKLLWQDTQWFLYDRKQ